jgi:hypothetical protein
VSKKKATAKKVIQNKARKVNLTSKRKTASSRIKRAKKAIKTNKNNRNSSNKTHQRIRKTPNPIASRTHLTRLRMMSSKNNKHSSSGYAVSTMIRVNYCAGSSAISIVSVS